jgi:hypothetical protein
MYNCQTIFAQRGEKENNIVNPNNRLIEKLIIDKIMIKILPSQNKYSLGRMLIIASI